MQDGRADGTDPSGGPAEADAGYRRFPSPGEWARTVALAVGLFIFVRTFGVEAFKIPTGSMESTLLVGDFLLVNKAAFGARIPFTGVHLPALADPERGAVVVFTPPHDPSKHYVKRLVGIPGDTLEMRDKVLYRNGFEVREPYVQHRDRRRDTVHPDMRWQSNHLVASTRHRYQPTRDNWGPLVVPHGQFFVLGDNRDNSEDSRYWGFVPRGALTGRPWIVYFSYDSKGRGPVGWWQGVRWSRMGHAIR
ncbi:MAG: signal peptidase I [Gemmatimonadota bacterium]|nr:signal peptidase I [Gemmatimonadota bacterium]MDH5758607.1 signal peptidase I [Gemmatimonadota bacterium]